MKQPKGFVQTGKNNLLCKLNKSIYGLKQNPRPWYACTKTYLLWNDFAPKFADTNVYAKRAGALFVTITLYINDYIIVTNDHNYYHKQKHYSMQNFTCLIWGKLNIVLVFTNLKEIENFISWNLINLNI